MERLGCSGRQTRSRIWWACGVRSSELSVSMHVVDIHKCGVGVFSAHVAWAGWCASPGRQGQCPGSQGNARKLAHLRVLCDVLFFYPLGRAFEMQNSLRGCHRNGVTKRHSLRLCIWGPDGFAISSARSGTVDQLSVACPEAWVRGSLELLEVLETTSTSSQHCEEHAPCVSTSTRGAAPGPKSFVSTTPIY